MGKRKIDPKILKTKCRLLGLHNPVFKKRAKRKKKGHLYIYQCRACKQRNLVYTPTYINMHDIAHLWPIICDAAPFIIK